LLGDDVFQSTVFIFDLLQPLQLTALEATVLRLPAVLRLLGDPVRAAQVGNLPAGFAFFHDRQNLLVAEFAPFHRSSSERRASFYGGADYGGQVRTDNTLR
jgi:hypothetical protein